MLSNPELDRAFGALADPTRRALLEKLRSFETLTVSQLAAPFDMSLPAVMKHLAVLERAGLVVRQKSGRTVYCCLDTRPMSAAMAWLDEMQVFWNQRLDTLADFVETEAADEMETKRAVPLQSRTNRKPRGAKKRTR